MVPGDDDAAQVEINDRRTQQVSEKQPEKKQKQKKQKKGGRKKT